MGKNRLLLKYILPSIFGSFVLYLCFIIDGVFVGNGVGQDAVGAINIVYPYVMFHMSLILMCSIGAMTITAIRIGRNDIKGANISFMNCIGICILISTIMSLFGIFKTEWICRLFGAKEQFIGLARDYLFYYAILLLPCGLYIAFSAIVRTDGEPLLASIAVIVMSICNICGDWLFMYPLHMGIKGAALAAGISQVIALFILLIHFFRRKGILRFNLYKIDIYLIRKIIIRGIPECINQFSFSVTILCMNQSIAKNIGEVGINAFAIVCYGISFAITYFRGVSEGIRPLYGKAYGENNENDVKYYFRKVMMISVASAILIIILLNYFSLSFCLLFNPEREVIDMSTRIIKIVPLYFISFAINNVISSYLYSTTRTKFAVIINICRGIVINVFVIKVISMIDNAKYIWFSSIISEGIVMIIAIIIYKIIDKNGIISETKE